MIYLFGVLIAIGAAAAVGGGAFALRAVRLGENRDKWQDQVANSAGAMVNALFLASFALSVVISWQAYDHARADVAAEAAALTGVYTDVGGLPDAAQLRHEIADYATVVVDQEWPLLANGSSSGTAEQDLRQLAGQILAVPGGQDSALAVRQEAIKQLDAVSSARDLRLQDANRTLPAGLLVSLLITAVAVLANGLLIGAPHSLSSAITLILEGALIASAVFIVFVIRRPYHGAFDIGPDLIRTALARFTANS
ncbi:MAG TPA: hypothetical protein VEO01_26850 [Pseudonocardiaceae bacterium]|nr:hypothetical protein [Pseudonocardiaceae bacterium]